ncbi:MAG: phytanoyl-CoA dioxygenase family protein [Deltaproteobacteria bacterium]|nr:phytanoyl-CoA dioxygenase family protein [Deltaproteobacteria bacterium]
MTKRNLNKIRAEFDDTGHVILSGFFPKKLVNSWRSAAEDLFLRASFAARADRRFLGPGSLVSFVVHPSFVVIRPVPEITFYSNHIFGNKKVHTIVSALLGTSDHYTPLYDVGFNTSGKKPQHIHRDFSPILPQLNSPLPTTTIALAVPLVNMDEDNGVLELWPGSHKLIDSKLRFNDRLDGQVGKKKGVRPFLPAGSLFLRDTRLIHRGMPNPSQDFRPWLSAVCVHPVIPFTNKITMAKTTWNKLNATAKKQFRYVDVVDKPRWTL